MNHIEEFSFNNHNRNDLVKAKTGGTTGTALKFYYEKDTLAKEYAHVFAKSRNGYKPTDKHATFNGRIIVPSTQQSPPFWRENKAINQTLYSGYHLKEENLSHYVKDLLNKEPKYITGYPSHIYIVADYIVRKSIDLENPPERIFTSSETISPQQRSIIENAFKCKVFDFYGQGEKISQIYQCEYGNYHYVYDTE
jgi:phenylacetate-CoA ligase